MKEIVVISGKGGTGKTIIVASLAKSKVMVDCDVDAVPVMVCVNKYDLNEDNTRQIESYCHNQGIEVASGIPFDNVVTEVLVEGLPVVEYSDNGVSQ